MSRNILAHVKAKRKADLRRPEPAKTSRSRQKASKCHRFCDALEGAQRMRVRVIAAKNSSKPVERRRSGRCKGEAIRKNTVIIIALVCIFGGAPASLAGQSRRDCEAPGHFPRTCHCHSKHGDFVRYRARLIGPFESEYDVEKWEQALRQGQQRQPSENSRLEGSHSSNGWHFDHRRHLRWPTAPRRRVPSY